MNKFILFAFNNVGGYKKGQSTQQVLMLQGMFTVLGVRMYQKCDALYDQYGDKVLVHYKSSLTLALTKELEDQKKKLADKVT